MNITTNWFSQKVFMAMDKLHNYNFAPSVTPLLYKTRRKIKDVKNVKVYFYIIVSYPSTL